MTCVIFIRHGETNWNVEQRWQGQIDVPMNATGHQQAVSTAAALELLPISAIYSSDLIRTQESAGYLARKFNLPVQTDPRLREIHQGMWQGLSTSEIQTRYALKFEERTHSPLEFAPPGGESVREVGERLASFLIDLIDIQPESTVAVVTHGFVIALLQVLVKSAPFEEIWQNIPKSGAWIEHCISMADAIEFSQRFMDYSN